MLIRSTVLAAVAVLGFAASVVSVWEPGTCFVAFRNIKSAADSAKKTTRKAAIASPAKITKSKFDMTDPMELVHATFYGGG